jgi:tetratricopeptide (TPR) repeat protein
MSAVALIFAALLTPAVAQEPVREEVIGVVQAPVSDADPVQQAARTIDAVDWMRLQRERDYAQQILDAIDLVRRRVPGEEVVSYTEELRLFALVTTDRRSEALAVVDRTLSSRPATAMPYRGAWFAALRLDDTDRAIRIVEQAARTLRSNQWPVLREILEKDSVWSLLGVLHARNDKPSRARLAEALLQVGWPGYQELESLDALRMMLVEDRIVRGDRSGASAVASGIGTPQDILRMILQRQYDDLLAPGEDRLSVLSRVVTDYDRHSAERLAAAPEDMQRVLDRAQFLRGLGREAEALALLEPFTRDVPAIVARNDRGMWVVNEAAYALIALRRDDEAVALTAQLAALPIEPNPALIGPSINHGAVLLRVGRHAEALAHALHLEREQAAHANDYGKMWIYGTIVCAMERLNRRDEAEPWLNRMRESSDDNPSALTQAYLCRNDLDAAEALLVQRLEGREPEMALRAIQIYAADNGAPLDPIDERLDIVRERPAVRAAAGRVGRILELPLSRIYWGTT